MLMVAGGQANDGEQIPHYWKNEPDCWEKSCSGSAHPVSSTYQQRPSAPTAALVEESITPSSTTLSNQERSVWTVPPKHNTAAGGCPGTCAVSSPWVFSLNWAQHHFWSSSSSPPPPLCEVFWQKNPKLSSQPLENHHSWYATQMPSLLQHLPHLAAHHP